MTELDIKPKSIIITISFFIIAIISLYFFKFGQFELGDQATFGQFGDYIGGTLNPFLSFFSILLLIWSIHGQSKQNTLALDALQQAQKFHQEQKLAQKSEKLIKTLEAHLNECDRLLNLPIFFYQNNFLSKSALISLNDIFRNPIFFGDPKILKIIEQIKNPSTSYIILHISTLRTKTSISVYCTCNLIESVEIEALRKIYYMRLSSLLVDLSSFGVLTDKESQELQTALIGAESMSIKK